ncbi:MAG TPA: hypothetical protein PLU53_13250, partial [Bacteroidia bacterium]|nr:hypothetical protein [Bacteroidia bacterium]
MNQLYDDVFHIFSNADSIQYLYLPSGLPEMDLDYSWNGSAWDLSYRNLYTYTPGLNTLLVTGQNFLGQWENAKKDSFGYSSNNLQSDRTSFYFNPTLQQWFFTKRSLYVYSAANQLTVQTDQDFVQNVWRNRFHYTSFYAVDSTLSSFLTEHWDTAA